MRSRQSAILFVLPRGLRAAPPDDDARSAPPIAVMAEVRPGTPLDTMLGMLDQHLVRALEGQLDGGRRRRRIPCAPKRSPTGCSRPACRSQWIPAERVQPRGPSAPDPVHVRSRAGPGPDGCPTRHHAQRPQRAAHRGRPPERGDRAGREPRAARHPRTARRRFLRALRRRHLPPVLLPAGVPHRPHASCSRKWIGAARSGRDGGKTHSGTIRRHAGFYGARHREEVCREVRGQNPCIDDGTSEAARRTGAVQGRRSDMAEITDGRKRRKRRRDRPMEGFAGTARSGRPSTSTCAR
jgi:hypothetical protein